ncbi:MAG TPA: glucose 1-dehydrogenase [Acidimicrobiales bacterium]|jgi:NAD(P)-dependent dehydrogenase (short-subunit alcohol dehydrogenase family)|nr:glucose 1-dehydrogenase [Acidimicrobiales bacterium]
MATLSGKTAIVTGAGSGIGRQSAQALACAGANVVVADLDAEAGKTTAALIEAGGGHASVVRTDVTDAADVEAMVAHAVATYGRLDLAHNNAGILGGSAVLTEVDDDDWRRVIEVNLTSVYLCLKHEIRAMLAAGGGGSIVNTASYSGLVGLPFASAYVASKHGVVGLTKAAAVEYGRKGIRVNAVCPGTVRTAMMEERIAENPKMEKALLDVSPMRRLAEAAEIGDAVVWLCSDAASFVNGHALPVDGGATIQ